MTSNPSSPRGGDGASESVTTSWVEYVAIFVLSLVFLGLFFALYVTNAPSSFQSIVLVAGLTVVFTGLLRATGTFQGKGGTLGGAAAVFAVMFLVVEGARKLDQYAKIRELNGEIGMLKEQIALLKSNAEELEIGIKLLSAAMPLEGYTVETEQGPIEPKLGRYRVRLENSGGKIFISANDEKTGAPVTCFLVDYEHEPPKLFLYAVETAGAKPCLDGR